MSAKALTKTAEQDPRVSETPPVETVDDDHEYAVDEPAPVEDDDDGNDGPPDPAARTETRQQDDRGQTRQEKKRARGGMREANDELRRELAARDERLARLEGAAFRQPQAPTGPQSPAVPDAVDAQISGLTRTMKALNAAFLANPQSPDVAEWKKDYDECEAELRKLHIRKELAAAQPQQRQQPGGDREAVYRTNFPDIYEPQNAHVLADARKRVMAKLNAGAPNSMTTVVQAVNEARAQAFKPARQPTQADRNRHSGMPRSGGSRADDGAGETYKMTQADKDRADKRFSHIPVAKRYKMYFEKTIRPVLLEKRKRQPAQQD